MIPPLYQLSYTAIKLFLPPTEQALACALLPLARVFMIFYHFGNFAGDFRRPSDRNHHCVPHIMAAFTYCSVSDTLVFSNLAMLDYNDDACYQQ
jgi:hypothetical protein